jgi:hypothetical protein
MVEFQSGTGAAVFYVLDRLSIVWESSRKAASPPYCRRYKAKPGYAHSGDRDRIRKARHESRQRRGHQKGREERRRAAGQQSLSRKRPTVINGHRYEL